MSDWQPIETAPKDGSYMLMGAPGKDPWIGYWYQSQWDISKGPPVARWEMGDGVISNPTHWMPLPDPPR